MYFLSYTLWALTMMLSATVGVVLIVSYVRTRQVFQSDPENFFNSSIFDGKMMVHYSKASVLNSLTYSNFQIDENNMGLKLYLKKWV